MGIWDKLQKSILVSKTTINDTTAEKPVDRRSLSATEIDDLQRVPASPRYQKIIHDRFYRNYPEKPFISKDREVNTNWIQQAEFTLQHVKTNPLVTIDKMTRYADGLLAGHIYMLYWLGKYGQGRRIPSYFEYKYGIDFIKEQQFLIENGYLVDAKPTSKGANAIVTHFFVVEEHSSKASGTKKA